jgi:hypothetical protein
MLGVGMAALLVAVMAGPAAAKTVAPERYAKSVCSVLSSSDDFVAAYNAIDTTDPVTFHTQAVQLGQDYLDQLEKGGTKLEKLNPDIKGGKKVSRLFTGYIDEIATAFQAALDTFEGTDPNGITFSADVAIFNAEANLVGPTTSDPFAEVTNQDMLEAFDEEPTCDELVTVI